MRRKHEATHERNRAQATHTGGIELMAYDGQPGEYEVECEECGAIFMAAGTWEVESYDMCTTRQEFTPDSDETICPDCRELPVHEVYSP